MKKNTNKGDRKQNYLNEVYVLWWNIWKQTDFEPMHIITSTYNMSLSVKLSSKTIHMYLRKYEMSNYVSVTDPLLYLKNICKRKKWTGNIWNGLTNNGKMLCSVTNFRSLCDLLYSSLEFGGILEGDLTSAIQSLFKYRYVILSVRAAYSAKGQTFLVNIRGLLEQEKYINIARA